MVLELPLLTHALIGGAPASNPARGPVLTDVSQTIDRVFRHALGRPPSAVERRVAEDALRDSARGNRPSPQGLAASKSLTTAAVLEAFDRQAEELTEQSARLFVSEEAREGMLAFLQKRPPNWIG